VSEANGASVCVSHAEGSPLTFTIYVIAAHGRLALGRSMKPHVSTHRLHNISVDQVD
jgi:hypothetical protein